MFNDEEKKWLSLAGGIALTIAALVLISLLTGCGMKIQVSWDHKIGDHAYEKDADGAVRATGQAAINASKPEKITIDKTHFGPYLDANGRQYYPGVR